MASQNAVGPRETWASRMGLILAMAGNAIGLGNFLRFPGKVAAYGGGAFLIPYFIALFILGLPIMWLEWTIGRYGGQYRAHWIGPMMYIIARKRFSNGAARAIAAVFGGLALVIGVMITAYYTNILGWSAFWAGMSISGSIMQVTTVDTAVSYFVKLLSDPLYNLVPFAITLFFLYIIVSPGIVRGIERAAKIMMPLLFLFAIGLVITAFVWRTPVKPEWDSLKGFYWLWTPRYEKLADPATWLEGAGQIFFSLSVGIGGIIPTYASYLRRNEDVALGALTTVALNEFAEVICGGSIAFMLGYAFGGETPIGLVYVDGKSPFSLTMYVYPAFFGNLGAIGVGAIGAVLASLWYLLLWFAGATSAMALVNTVVEVFQDLGVRRPVGALICTAILFVVGLPIVIEGSMTIPYEWGPTTAYLDFTDFVVGSFLLVVFALLETVFAGAFLWKEGYEEVNRGGWVAVPKWIWTVVLSVVAPVYLVAMVLWLPYSTKIGRLITTGPPLEWLGPALAGLSSAIMVVLFVIGFAITYRVIDKKYSKLGV